MLRKLKVVFSPTSLPCTCLTDPYNCPQGQALVRAIHDRKQAQGDDFVRNA